MSKCPLVVLYTVGGVVVARSGIGQRVAPGRRTTRVIWNGGSDSGAPALQLCAFEELNNEHKNGQVQRPEEL